jgi:hypothetical protein
VTTLAGLVAVVAGSAYDHSIGGGIAHAPHADHIGALTLRPGLQ